MEKPAYIVGIDLGTTNCALAFAQPSEGPQAAVCDFAIPQLERAGEVVSSGLLPSCLYVPGEHELPVEMLRLPWANESGIIVGEFARWQGARVPGRLVASAKSWLCHPGVDRSAPILPWGAPPEVSKMSPVRASALLLGHLLSAWNSTHPTAPLAYQEVVITVPASFDEVARALTVNAARQAGFEHFTLVEEPQAAFYDFTARHGSHLARILKDVRLVLVVDVGGGTTDFTLIETGVFPDGPRLRRLAVGDHLMLGGDNMDAALARTVEAQLLGPGRKLSASQWVQLLQGARRAKESLLGSTPPERYAVAVGAEGSRLLAGTLSGELTRRETEDLILDGFFPACAIDDAPRRGNRVALQEMGLPYAQDPAVTRHLVAFLHRHAASAFAALGIEPNSGDLPRPDALLLNGGVFNSSGIAARLVDVLSAWWPGTPRLPLLEHGSLELAVARGAACYGLARLGLGRRIGGGTAQALYVGLAAEKDGAPAQAVCLIPRGQEEGQPVDLKARPFKLILGRPVQFPIFSTTSDRVDRAGDVVETGDDFLALPPIHTLFKDARGKTTSVPVHLRATLTELGSLELWCVANASDERWRLEFDLRGAMPSPAATVTESMPARFGEVRTAVEAVYGPRSSPDASRAAKQLGRSLERVIGPRESWRLPILRELWSVLSAGAGKRRRSAEHERGFFQLLGYSLRPGFGYPLDDWRCEQTFRLFGEGVTFHAEQTIWNEFWVMWRRIAGGLAESAQKTLWDYLKPHLAQRLAPGAAKEISRPKGIQPKGWDEMVRVAASLEHIEASEKTILGNWIAARLSNPANAAGPRAWALGRLGARVPVYGSGHKTVAPEQAASWLSLLVELGVRQIDGALFAVVQLARLTGDRTRDLDEAVRIHACAALRAAEAPNRWVAMVAEVVPLETTDEAQALGDTLPIGLRLR